MTNDDFLPLIARVREHVSTDEEREALDLAAECMRATEPLSVDARLELYAARSRVDGAAATCMTAILHLDLARGYARDAEAMLAEAQHTNQGTR